MNMPPAFVRACDMQRTLDHGTATVAELEQAAKWVPVRGYEFSGDAITILRRKGHFDE